jgi:hypothetical protein
LARVQRGPHTHARAAATAVRRPVEGASWTGMRACTHVRMQNLPDPRRRRQPPRLPPWAAAPRPRRLSSPPSAPRRQGRCLSVGAGLQGCAPLHAWARAGRRQPEAAAALAPDQAPCRGCRHCRALTKLLHRLGVLHNPAAPYETLAVRRDAGDGRHHLLEGTGGCAWHHRHLVRRWHQGLDADRIRIHCTRQIRPQSPWFLLKLGWCVCVNETSGSVCRPFIDCGLSRRSDKGRGNGAVSCAVPPSSALPRAAAGGPPTRAKLRHRVLRGQTCACPARSGWRTHRQRGAQPPSPRLTHRVALGPAPHSPPQSASPTLNAAAVCIRSAVRRLRP